MTKMKQEIKLNLSSKIQDTKVDNTRIFSEMTKKDIEKSYNLESVNGTEAHYSNRYGWTLRRSEN